MFNLTVEDASKRLGVGRARVNQLIRSGMLAAEKVGGIWLIDEQSVEARRNAAPKAGRPPASSSKGDVGRYVLMNRTHEVLSFRYDEAAGAFVDAGDIVDPARAPLGMISPRGRKVSKDALSFWWKHRCIPGTREGIDAKLAELGVDGADALQAAALPFAEQGCTVVLAALDGQAAGFIALADTVRPTAEAAVRGIRTLGVEPVLLTGDHAQAARHIAAQAGIVEVEADCLPQNKLAAVERLEREGAPVCMVGDGINDAPALKRASVGIAMGGAGSDIAVDAADIALVRDDIAALPHLLAISQRMMTTIKLNMGFSLGLNFVAIALAMTGILNPVVGALVHNAGSVIVIVNSALLLKWKHRGGSEASGDASPASAPGAATALRDLEPDAEAA